MRLLGLISIFFKKIDQLHNGKKRNGSKRNLKDGLSNSPSPSGSLHFFAKKREAQRIDEENKKMATRLLSTNGLYSPRTFVKDEIKTN